MTSVITWGSVAITRGLWSATRMTRLVSTLPFDGRVSSLGFREVCPWGTALRVGSLIADKASGWPPPSLEGCEMRSRYRPERAGRVGDWSLTKTRTPKKVPRAVADGVSASAEPSLLVAGLDNQPERLRDTKGSDETGGAVETGSANRASGHPSLIRNRTVDARLAATDFCDQAKSSTETARELGGSNGGVASREAAPPLAFFQDDRLHLAIDAIQIRRTFVGLGRSS